MQFIQTEFELSDKIHIAQTLFFVNADVGKIGDKFSLAKITNMQIDKNDVNEVPENTNVGCELDINIKD